MSRRLERSVSWVEAALSSERVTAQSWNPEFELQLAENLRYRMAAENMHTADLPKPAIQYERIPCPLCGAPTTGQHNWFGAGYKQGIRKGHTPYLGPQKGEWDCTKDTRHYLWQRTNEQLIARGMAPKTLAEWEAYDGATIATQRLQIELAQVQPPRTGSGGRSGNRPALSS